MCVFIRVRVWMGKWIGLAGFSWTSSHSRGSLGGGGPNRGIFVWVVILWVAPLRRERRIYFPADRALNWAYQNAHNALTHLDPHFPFSKVHLNSVLVWDGYGVYFKTNPLILYLFPCFFLSTSSLLISLIFMASLFLSSPFLLFLQTWYPCTQC